MSHFRFLLIPFVRFQEHYDEHPWGNVSLGKKIAVAANALIQHVQIILAEIANFLAVFTNVRFSC